MATTDRRIYTIELHTISQGATCKNPVIRWEKPECVNVRCGEEDDKILTVEVPADCPDPCIYVTVDCTGDCELCEPKRIKVCPCEVPADCADCETCVNNLCVSTCDDGDFCLDDGTCGECDDTHPCPCNQRCVNGICQCPAGLPFEDEKGCCSDCNPDFPCPPCFKCTPSGCVPLDCLCNPDNGVCVECLNSTDCTEANTCCINDSCQCCPGYVLDVTTGNCIPAPDCIRDTDCSECQNCEDSFCVDATCPTGYIRIAGLPCCVKECDCDAPSCARGENCTRLDSTHCYCAPCSGSCNNNGDCGENCYCDNEQCKPNPCDSRCNNGGDCPDGCGCDENGWCVPCSSLDCSTNECINVDGCDCNGNNCEKDGCGGGCSAVSDCPPGCACYQGTCVKCSDLDCTQCPFALGCDCIAETCIDSLCRNNCVNADDCYGVNCGCKNNTCVSCLAYTCEIGCPEGCICLEDGTCGGNPCANTYCSTDSDCGENCYCDGGLCKPCPSDNPNCGSSTCSDLLILGKVEDGCDLSASLTTKQCCECEENSAGLKLNAPTSDGTNRYKFDAEIQLRHGSNISTWSAFTGQTYLGSFDLGDLPELAVFVTRVEQIYTGGYTSSVNEFSNLAGKDKYLITDTPKIEFTQIGIPGQIYFVNGQNRTLLSVKISFGLLGSLKMPDGCIYELPASVVFEAHNKTQLLDLANQSRAFELIKFNLCKLPRFSWYRSDNPTTILTGGSNFRNEYAEFSSTTGTYNIYVDTVKTIAEGLLYGYYYRVHSNCSCASDRIYSCEGQEGTPTKLVFCHPDNDTFTNSSFTISDCCKKVTFNEVTVDCDIMTGASPGVKYDLYLNNNYVTQYTLLSTGVLIPNGTVYTYTEAITSLTLKIHDDPCDQCDIIKIVTCESGSVDFDFIISPCYTVGDISIKITTTGASTGAKDYVIANGTDPDITGTFYGSTVTVPNVAVTEGNYDVTVTLADGCELTKSKELVLLDTDPDTNLIITSGCNGVAGYITGTNHFSSTAVLDIAGDLYYVPAGGSLTVSVTSGVLYDVSFYVQSDVGCVVNQDDLVVTCCDALDLNDIDVTFECVSADDTDTTVELTLDNSAGAFPVIFSFSAYPGGPAIASEVTVAAAGTDTTTVTTSTGNIIVKVRSSANSSCTNSTLKTLDVSSCLQRLLDELIFTHVCGDGGQVLFAVDNQTIPLQAYNVTVNSVIVYTGTANYSAAWPGNSSYNVKISLASGGGYNEYIFVSHCV